jgi:hypothetical protein
MFFAVEGEPPFDKGTLVQTLAAVVNEDPRQMLRAGPLEALLTALLTKNPEDRLSASRVRIWLRWLVDVAHSAPPPEVLSTQGPGGTILHPPAHRLPSLNPPRRRWRPWLRPPPARWRRQRPIQPRRRPRTLRLNRLRPSQKGVQLSGRPHLFTVRAGVGSLACSPFWWWSAC